MRNYAIRLAVTQDGLKVQAIICHIWATSETEAVTAYGNKYPGLGSQYMARISAKAI